MDVDESSSPAKQNPSPQKPTPRPKPAQETEEAGPTKDKKKRKQQTESTENGGDSSRKLQRKKEIILRKSLQVALANTSTTSDTSVVVLETGSTEITAQSVSEVLALRLSLTKDDLPMGLSTQPLLAYLAQSHRTASEELKTLQQSSRPSDPEILDLLKEIQRQVVNYAATCLQEPDLFAMAEGASMQLAKCLTNALTADAVSIAFGVNGATSSFYYCLVEELLVQDAATLDRVVTEIVDYFTQQLSKVDNVLDDSGPDGSALQIVMALVNLCMHKKAAHAVSQIPSFLLPAAGTPKAIEQIAPPLPAGNRLLQQFMAGLNPPYQRRSGPGLEKHTLLGLCLRVGIPKNNPAFPSANILRQTIPAIEAATKQQRGQLRAYQTALNQLLMNLIKGGPDARGRVMEWFRDALLVNVGATATRPDPSKVSSQALLLNLSVVLLKFCEPFVKAEAKHALIDIGFLSSPSAHGGVFATTGDWAVDRLGESGDGNVTEDRMDEYNPKNAFIPHVCFFTARSLHVGLASMLSQHDNLLRSIGHIHWMITNRGGDLASDPHFGMYVARQRSQEVSLYQEDMVEQALRFCDLLAKVLYTTPPEEFKHMPEHFVSDICDILTLIAKRKPRLLRGMQFGETFRMVVKLLSPTYASVRQRRMSLASSQPV
jgi:ubiquitin conjugation factor E4 B